MRQRWMFVLSVFGLVTGCMDAIPIEVPDQGHEVDQALPDASLDAETSDLGLDDLGMDADVGPTVILEVGYGDPTQFMLAPGNGTATAVPGIQGGYHLDMGFRVRGLSAADFNSGDWLIAYEYRSATGVPLSEPITRVLSLVGVSFDGTGQVRTGDLVFFASSDPSVHSLTTITLEVRLTNGARTYVDSEQVMLVVP